MCGKRLTTGVLHRVEQLADRPEGYLRPRAPKWERLIPLPEVLSATLGGGPDSKRNQSRYAELLDKLGPEFFILRECPLEDLARAAGPCVAEGVRRLRAERSGGSRAMTGPTACAPCSPRASGRLSRAR